MDSIFLIIGEIFSRVIVIYIGIFAGFLFIKSPLQRFRKQFIDIAIYVLTPLLIYFSFLTIDSSQYLIYPIIGAILVTVIGVFLPGVLAKITNSNPPAPAEICTATFPNALNFPFPIIYAFAPTSLGLASLFLAITTIARNTVGFWIADSSMGRQSLILMARFPPIWAIILGIITRVGFPDQAMVISQQSFVDPILQIGIIATLMTVGFSLKIPKIEYKAPILRTSIVRFFVMGVLSFGIVIIFKVPFLVAIPLIVQSMAPPAVYNALYAEKLGLDIELTTQIIVALTVIALLLVPFEIALIQFLS
ncbi:MAG: AEC family transporter [Candidatus Kariarchaeaceae archaeon]